MQPQLYRAMIDQSNRCRLWSSQACRWPPIFILCVLCLGQCSLQEVGGEPWHLSESLKAVLLSQEDLELNQNCFDTLVIVHVVDYYSCPDSRLVKNQQKKWRVMLSFTLTFKKQTLRTKLFLGISIDLTGITKIDCCSVILQIVTKKLYQ